MDFLKVVNSDTRGIQFKSHPYTPPYTNIGQMRFHLKIFKIIWRKMSILIRITTDQILAKGIRLMISDKNLCTYDSID